jgi:spore germination protein YaaH
MKLVISFFIMVVFLVLATQLPRKSTLLSPHITPVNPANQTTPTKLVVYGFMPYWNLAKLSPHHAIPDIIVYSGITLDETGRVVKDTGYTNLGRQSFATLQQSLVQNDQQLHLSFTIFSTETINALMASESAQLQAIDTMMDLLDTHNASGINIDFEPNSPIAANTPTQFTQFVEKVSAVARKRALPPTITIDMFGRQNPGSLWQVEKLSPYVGAFVLMAYDYHQRGSSIAGPVAPMFGSGSSQRWGSDISQSLWLLRQKVTHEKIVLGMPFYGYDWRVVTPDQSSQTFPKSGITATYERVKQLIESQGMIPKWDKDALSPWVVATTNNEVRQIYFENQQSITHKLTLAKQAQLHGVAIWALGYEGETDDLWQPFVDISDSNSRN